LSKRREQHITSGPDIRNISRPVFAPGSPGRNNPATMSPQPEGRSGRSRRCRTGRHTQRAGAAEGPTRSAYRPTYLPLQLFAEADKASQLLQYYLLDTDGFEPNVFTTITPGLTTMCS